MEIESKKMKKKVFPFFVVFRQIVENREKKNQIKKIQIQNQQQQ